VTLCSLIDRCGGTDRLALALADSTDTAAQLKALSNMKAIARCTVEYDGVPSSRFAAACFPPLIALLDRVGREEVMLAAARAVAGFMQLMLPPGTMWQHQYRALNVAHALRRLVLGSAECIKQLAALLQGTEDHEEEEEDGIAHCAVRALNYLTYDRERMMCERVAAIALPALAACMPNGNKATLSHAVSVMERLTNTPELVAQLSTDACVCGLVEALKAGGTTEKLAAQVLARLCASHNASVRNPVANSPLCIPTLLQVIRETDKGTGHALTALGFLSLLGDDAVRNRIVRSQGIETFVDTLRHPALMHVFSADATWCLCSLAAMGTDAVRKKIKAVASGVLKKSLQSARDETRDLAARTLAAVRGREALPLTSDPFTWGMGYEERMMKALQEAERFAARLRGENIP